MRDFSQALPFLSQAAEREGPLPELRPEVNHLQAEIGRERHRVPAGLLAAAVLATLAAGKEEAGRAAEAASDAWLDSALEDSFPASDPISSNRYN